MVCRECIFFCFNRKVTRIISHTFVVQQNLLVNLLAEHIFTIFDRKDAASSASLNDTGVMRFVAVYLDIFL